MDTTGKRYAVVIGDLVDSRAIESRSAFQRRFAAVLQTLSAKAGTGLCSPFTLTLGDEFQAVFANGNGLFRSLLEIRAHLHPIECRFSVALGPLDTEINPKQALAMDGPAFHRARRRIETLKANDHPIALELGDHPQAQLVDTGLRLLWESTRNWNQNRLNILLRLAESEDRAPPGFGLNISERAIYKNIREARLKDWRQLILEAESQISTLLRS